MTITKEQKQAFEQWYVENAFDYVANPIGSRDCGLQRAAWNAGFEAGCKSAVSEPVAEVVEDNFSRQVKGVGQWHKLPNGTKLYATPPAAAVSEPVKTDRRIALENELAAAVKGSTAWIADMKATPPATAVSEPVKIDYTVLYEFAEGNAISYNKLCTAVNMAIATPPAEAKLEPLSLEQINDIGSTAWCAQDRDSNDPEDDFKVLFARAIEAAHGIVNIGEKK